MSLFDEIRDCWGKDDCFGRIAEVMKPIVFYADPNVVKVMVITEQPRGDRVNKETLKKALDEAPRGGVPQRLKQLLGNKFYESVESESGAFYWTRYIKCPGNFRGLRKTKGKKITNKDLDVCANEHLKREIEYLKLSLIVSVGSKCGAWILKTFKDSLSYDSDWREHLWRQISMEEVTKIRVDGEEVQVFFLIHPSERSGIGWFIDRKLKDLIQKTIKR